MDDNLTEVIDHTDSQGDRLKALTERFNAVNRILNAYNHYNRLMMIEKLRAYIAATREFDKAADEYRLLTVNKAETENSTILNNETIIRLRDESKECEQIIGELSEKHYYEAEATKKLTLLKIEAENCINSLKKKNEELLTKRARIGQCNTIEQTLGIEAEWRLGHINEAIKNMGRLAEKAAFEKHSLVIGINPYEEYNFQLLYDEIIKHGEALRDGAGLFEDINRLLVERESLRGALDNINMLLEGKGKEFEAAEAAFLNLKLELKQDLADWAAGNNRLTVLPDMMEGINNAVNTFKYTDERLSLAPFVNELLFALRGAIDQKIGGKKVYLSMLIEEKGYRQAEIRRLREIEEADISGAARRRNHRASIYNLQVEIGDLVRQIAACETEIGELKAEIADLMDEYIRMPNSDRLAEASDILRSLNNNIKITQIECQNLTNRMIPIENDIQFLNAEIAGLCGRIHLPADIGAFETALKNIRQYGYDLTEFIDKHNNLHMNTIKIIDIKELLETLEKDLDNLIHDEAGIKRRQDSILTEINIIEEHLRASGYEEAIQTIGIKRHRTEEIRNCLDILQKTAGALDSKLKSLNNDIERAQCVKSTRENELSVIRQTLEEEAALMYTDIRELNPNDRGSVNKALNHLELGKRDFASISVEDMEKEVHSRLLDNMRYLTDYSPREANVFKQHTEINLKIKRIIITCMSEGREIGIAALYDRLEKEIEMQRELVISDM